MNCKKCKREIPDDAIYCCYCGTKQAIAAHNVKSRGNGTGTIYKLSNGKYKVEIVQGYYREDGKLKKRRKTKTCEKKKDALEIIQKLKSSDVGQDKSITLHELYEIFKSTKRYDKLSKSQKDKLSYAWNKAEKLQFTKISELTVDLMQEAIDGKTSTYYPARDMKVLFSHLYTLAIQRQKEIINKSEYIELPDAPNAKREAFTEEEVAKFWDDYYGQSPESATDPHEFAGYILIMIYTGMRIGELYKVKKENIYIDEHYMIGGEKSEAGIDREIPIANVIENIVKYFYSANDKSLVGVRKDKFYDMYWETIKRLGVRELPPHTCRHTYFTRLAQEKVHPALIACMGGHAQYETAIDNYNRLPLKDKINAVNKI